MKKEELMKLVGKRVLIHFDEDACLTRQNMKAEGILQYVPYNSVDKYGNNYYYNGHGQLVKEDYFYIGLNGFKVSHIKSIKVKERTHNE